MTIGDVRTGVKPKGFAELRLADEERAARRELAACLMTLARRASDFADFCELVDIVSPVSFKPDQLERLHEGMLAIGAEPEAVVFVEPEPVLMGPPLDADEIAWRAWEKIALQVRKDIDDIWLRAMLVIALDLAGSDAEFSANTFLPILPPDRAHVAGQVIQRLQRSLFTVGSEPSRSPARRRGKVKVYRGAPVSLP